MTLRTTSWCSTVMWIFEDLYSLPKTTMWGSSVTSCYSVASYTAKTAVTHVQVHSSVGRFLEHSVEMQKDQQLAF